MYMNSRSSDLLFIINGGSHFILMGLIPFDFQIHVFFPISKISNIHVFPHDILFCEKSLLLRVRSLIKSFVHAATGIARKIDGSKCSVQTNNTKHNVL